MKLLLIAIILILSGCADQIAPEQIKLIDPVGFWYGLWHGFIAIFALVVSIFDDSVAVYAVYNNGFWYNLGFILGANLTIASTKS